MGASLFISGFRLSKKNTAKEGYGLGVDNPHRLKGRAHAGGHGVWYAARHTTPPFGRSRTPPYPSTL